MTRFARSQKRDAGRNSLGIQSVGNADWRRARHSAQRKDGAAAAIHSIAIDPIMLSKAWRLRHYLARLPDDVAIMLVDVDRIVHGSKDAAEV